MSDDQKEEKSGSINWRELSVKDLYNRLVGMGVDESMAAFMANNRDKPKVEELIENAFTGHLFKFR